LNEDTLVFDKVPKKQKIAYAISIAGTNLLGTIILGAMLKYYTDFILLPQLLFGIAQLIYSIWNAVNDPILGYLSDKRIPREGNAKRKPWLWFSLPFMVAGYFILIIVNPSWNAGIIFTILLIGLIAYDTGWAMFMINRNSLMASITNVDSERSSLVVYSLVFQTILGVLAYILPFLFLTGDVPIPVIILVFAIVGIGSTILGIFGIKGIKEPPGLYVEKEPINIWKASKGLFNLKSYYYYIIYSFLVGAVGGTQLTFMLFYIEHVAQTTGILAVLASAIALPVIFISYLLIQVISKKLGVRKTLLLFLSICVVGFIGLLIVSDFWLVLTFYMFIFAGTSAHWVLSFPLAGDIIDQDELKSGNRKEGMFFGISAIFLAPSTAVLIFLYTVIITVFGYDASLPKTPEVILGIRLGTALLPLIFIVASIFLLIYYPLRGAALLELKEDVKRLYDKKLERSEEK